ncbi:hypothetical protein ACHAWF_013672 [Thalassiosira exigua]
MEAPGLLPMWDGDKPESQGDTAMDRLTNLFVSIPMNRDDAGSLSALGSKHRTKTPGKSSGKVGGGPKTSEDETHVQLANANARDEQVRKGSKAGSALVKVDTSPIVRKGAAIVGFAEAMDEQGRERSKDKGAIGKVNASPNTRKETTGVGSTKAKGKQHSRPSGTNNAKPRAKLVSSPAIENANDYTDDELLAIHGLVNFCSDQMNSNPRNKESPESELLLRAKCLMYDEKSEKSEKNKMRSMLQRVAHPFGR